MSIYSEKLNKLNSEIDGIIISAFVSDDGLIIEQSGKNKIIDIELLSATLSSTIKKLKYGKDNPVEVIISYDEHIIFVRIFDDGFLCMALNNNSNLGRIKLEVKRLGKVFIGEDNG